MPYAILLYYDNPGKIRKSGKINTYECSISIVPIIFMIRMCMPGLGKSVLSTRQLKSTFCQYVKGAVMHYPETSST